MEFPTCYWTLENGRTKTMMLTSREDVKQVGTSLERDKHTCSSWQKSLRHRELYRPAFIRIQTAKGFGAVCWFAAYLPSYSLLRL
jgi:hypothetical protein